MSLIRARPVAALVTLLSALALVAACGRLPDVDRAAEQPESALPASEWPGPAAFPDELGSDAEMDSLAEDCFVGDLASCDVLYWSSELASVYESYGASCGGRIAGFDGEVFTGPGSLDDLLDDPNAFDDLIDELEESLGDPFSSGQGYGACTTDFPDYPVPEAGQEVPTPAPAGRLSGDPALDRLAHKCGAGDLALCDQPAADAPSGSEYRDYAETCGGRHEPRGSCAETWLD